MSSNIDKLRASQYVDNFNWQRLVRRELRNEAKQEAIKQQDELEQTLFTEKSLTKGETNETHGPGFDKYIMVPQDLQAATESDFDPDLVNQLLASSMDEGELEVMFNSFEKQNITKEKAETILNRLLDASEESSEAMLGGFIKNLNLNIAEIFVLLNYLFAEVSKKDQQKKKLLALLKNLLKKVDQQNSAYLTEFFSLMNNPLVKQNPKLAHGVASLSSGTIDMSSISDTLKFIHDYLENDFSNLVSKCIRLRFHVLSRLTKTNLSFENKHELSQYTTCERNLITVNSMYLKVDHFKTDVNQSDIWKLKISGEYADMIKAIVAFTESSIVTTMSMKNFVKSFGIDKDIKTLSGFKNKLIQFLSEMPMVVFNNTNSQRQKVIQGIRNLFAVMHDDGGEANKSNFEFLRPKKIPISYI